MSDNYCDHCLYQESKSCDEYCERMGHNIVAIRRMIEDAPAVDAVPVVRCKECKYWLKDVAECTESFGRCEWADWMVGVKWMIGENGYCIYGERKEVQE